MGIERIVTSNLPDVEVNVIPNISSFVNARAIGRGDAGYGIVLGDIAYYAFKGVKPYFEKPVGNIRGVATLFPETMHIVARKDANIRSVPDLKGKRVAVVAIGERKSGPEGNAVQILEAYGMRLEDLGKVEWLTITESINNLRNNKVDALFLLTITGSPDPVGAVSVPEAVIVPIDGAPADALMKKYGHYTKAKIPAGLYKSVTADVPTVAVWNLFAANADLDADIVYRTTKAIFENTNVMSAAHGLGRAVKLDTALMGMAIPLHPGAQKYYKEKGLIK